MAKELEDYFYALLKCLLFVGQHPETAISQTHHTMYFIES